MITKIAMVNSRTQNVFLTGRKSTIVLARKLVKLTNTKIVVAIKNKNKIIVNNLSMNGGLYWVTPKRLFIAALIKFILGNSIKKANII